MNALNADMTRVRHETDHALEKELPLNNTDYDRLIEAMRYATIGGGKAFRPLLVDLVAQLYNLEKTTATQIGTALEMVHSYSLIHDDLPCMDNDTVRRGKPSTHVQFGEATAVLAGDALLTHAFVLLSNGEIACSSVNQVKLIRLLAEAAGVNGMIGGQMIDLAGEKKALRLDQIKTMQRLKTGALIKFACIAPAVAADAPQNDINALEIYADALGRLFQLTDDILDVEADPVCLGKTTGKDEKAGKSTFISLLGVDKTRQAANECAQEALSALSHFGEKSHKLKDVIHLVLHRKK